MKFISSCAGLVVLVGFVALAALADEPSVGPRPVSNEALRPAPNLSNDNSERETPVTAGGGAIFWNNPAGGSFQTGGNWVGGVVPGPADTAMFHVVGSYPVSFASPTETIALSVREGAVTFNIGTSYTLLSGAVQNQFAGGVGFSGTLTITSGTLTSNTFHVGSEGGGAGTLVLDGSSTLFQSPLLIGALPGSSGTMIIQNGAVATATGTYPLSGNQGIVWLGSWPTSDGGQLTVTGFGSQLSCIELGLGSWVDSDTVSLHEDSLTVSNDAFIECNDILLGRGRGNTSVLLISSGGTVLTNNSGHIGLTAGSTGEITVTGSGSTWDVSTGQITVGNSGNGTVNVLNGGTVLSHGVLVAEGPLSQGDILISGPGSSWTSTDVWNVGGAAGSATLLVEDGGAVVITGSALAVSAGFPGSMGHVTVTGAGSSLSTTHELGVGAGGQHQGEMTIQDGASVSCRWGRIGWFSPGTLTVDGVGSTLIMIDDILVGNDSIPSMLAVSNGAVASVLNSGGGVGGRDSEILVSGAGSRLELGGAFFVFDGARLTVVDGAVVSTPFSIELETGDGKLKGNGTIDGRVNNNSGFVFPGSSAGILTILGDYLQQGRAELQIEIGGLTVGTDHDQLTVTGNVDLHGTLDVQLINAFTPSAGDTFDVLTYASQTGRFDTVLGENLGGGLRWALDYNPTVLTLIACDPDLDPSCDDCNQNGVLDGDDIANLTSLDLDFNGIPDECTQFTEGCAPDPDWSCFDNWDLPGDVYPDDVASAPGIYVTLDSTDAVFLDVEAVVPAMRILETASLSVSQVGTGDLTVYTDRGLTVEGTLLSGNDRAIDVPAGTLTIAPGGRYAEDFTAAGNGCTPADPGYACSTLSAARVEVLHGRCATPALLPGSLELSDSMSLNVIGDLILHGSLEVECPVVTAGITPPPPRTRITGSSRWSISNALVMLAAVDLDVNTTEELTLSGNFDNRAQFPSLFTWSNGRLILDGNQTFEVGGVDLGSTTDGYSTDVDTFFDTKLHTNFSMSAIEVASGANVTFVNNFANTNGGGCAEALYVHDLTLRTGATVVIDNCKVYYSTLTNEGVIPTLLGCGELLPDVPPDPPVAPPGGINKNRSLSVSIPVSTAGPGTTTAIRVRPLDLQNPDPPNAGCCSPPDFFPYEANSCSAAGESGGCARWAGPPVTAFESQGNALLGNYRVARLQCAPYYHDWSTEGVVQIVGAEVMPSSTYELVNFGGGCAGHEGNCTGISTPLIVSTSRHGDVASLFNPPSPTTQPDGNDVLALVNKFKNLPGAPPKATGQIFGNLVELNSDVSGLDISAVVDAFKGLAYPYSGPCSCPSAVTCNLTACTTPTPCGGGMCVKTCANGLNAGQPCLSDNHCPAGTCGTGFCRDRCGRCSP